MISVSQLSKTYYTQKRTGNPVRDLLARQWQPHQAVRGISFEIEEGSLVGFIGPNGAGKTTTLKMLSGILHPDGGSIKILGHRPFDKDHAFLKQIGFIMGQKNQLLWDLPALDTYEVNKAIYEIPDDQYRRTLADLTEMLDCADLIEQPVKTLSLGQRMRMEFIAALIHRPRVLFLDEPTIGLDIFAQATIRSFIKSYQQQYNATILLTSHYMQDVHHLAQRVMLINYGSIIFDGSLDQLVNRYTAKKTISITVGQELETLPEVVATLEHEYDYPMLRITVSKQQLPDVLSRVLESVEYRDVSIENEPLEQIIGTMITSDTASSVT